MVAFHGSWGVLDGFAWDRAFDYAITCGMHHSNDKELQISVASMEIITGAPKVI